MIKQGVATVGVGEEFEGFVLINDSKLGTARNGKPYLNVTLGDATGNINTMIWDANEEKEALFASGNIIKVRGSISEYQGKRQINIQKVRIKEESDNIPLSDLLESAPIQGEHYIS